MMQSALSKIAVDGAYLALARDMEQAVIVRDTSYGRTVRTGAVPRDEAFEMERRGYIRLTKEGRVMQYQITDAGRMAIETAAEPEPTRRARYGSTETPLVMLARRKEKDGLPFLSQAQVRAGERLREIHEIARMKGLDADETLANEDPEDQPAGPRYKFALAMYDLGPGLADVAFRVCCQHQGFETVERKFGWAARSGKIVLRIALDRLIRHFDGHDDGMVG